MFKNLSVKQRQRIIIGVVLGLVALLLLVGSYFSEKKKEGRAMERVKGTKRMSLLTDKVEKDLWIAAEGQNIKALEKSNEELTFKLEKVMKELEETKKELKKREAVLKVPPIPLPKPTPKTSEVKKEEKKGEVEFSFSEQPSLKVERPKEKPKGERKVEPSGSTIRVFKEEAPKEKKESERKADKKEETSFLPSGSFMKAILLTGIDAPAYGSAQSEPYPVLLSVMDLSVLPNRFRMNLKDCFIIGAGYGNLSDERAYIRTETLSCVRNDGTVIDLGLKGHVIGEDGKLGMRGRLVSKQGQKIAMAMLTGMLGSFAHAFRPQTATVLQLGTEGSGVFHYPVSDVLEAGVLGGVGNALNKIAEYYLKMADRIFPIIEVDAGREVEVFVLKGQELKLQGGKK
jgi:conjugal transfer pilus assembly protein TraB